jgi:hypothetical protein
MSKTPKLLHRCRFNARGNSSPPHWARRAKLNPFARDLWDPALPRKTYRQSLQRFTSWPAVHPMCKTQQIPSRSTFCTLPPENTEQKSTPSTGSQGETEAVHHAFLPRRLHPLPVEVYSSNFHKLRPKPDRLLYPYVHADIVHRRSLMHCTPFSTGGVGPQAAACHSAACQARPLLYSFPSGRGPR